MKRLHWSIATTRHWKRITIAPTIESSNRIIIHSTIRDTMIGGEPLSDYNSEIILTRWLRPLEIHTNLWSLIAESSWTGIPIVRKELMYYTHPHNKDSPYSWLGLWDIISPIFFRRPNNEVSPVQYYSSDEDVLICVVNIDQYNLLNTIAGCEKNLYSVYKHHERPFTKETLSGERLVTKWCTDPVTNSFRDILSHERSFEDSHGL